jgi:F0F1-type ATP synthase assembly protein I
MAGILASVLPNLIFVWLYFWRGSNTPRAIVKSFYWGEVLKVVVMVFLLSILLQLPQIDVLRFFSAFLLSEMTRLFYQFFRLARTTAE